jgi:hypothetical protein
MDQTYCVGLWAHVGTRVHDTNGQLCLSRTEAILRTMNTERMQQINNEMRDLCTELASLQERALHRVEEIENDFNGVVLSDDVKANFHTLQRLITRV